MAVRLEIDRASLTDNDIARQVEFTAELDGDERDFAVKYSVLKELSGDEPDGEPASGGSDHWPDAVCPPLPVHQRDRPVCEPG